jgi:ABC-type sugar transport system substrate-binding protein
VKTIVARPARAGGSGLSRAAMAAVLAALAVSSGCGSGSFVPPPPAELKPPAGSGLAATYDGTGTATPPPAPAGGKAESRRLPGAAPIVELVLARPANTDREFLQQALRREMGKGRIIFRVDQPESGASASPSRLAGAIRAAVARGVAGLIVEPLEDPAVIDALYDADRRGVAVLLLDQSIPPRDGKTIPRIEYATIADVGRQIVEDVLEVDRTFRRPRPGRVIILHHRADDPYLDRCHAALLGPVKEAGKPSEVIAFEGGSERAVEAVRKSLDADPNIDIILADDMYGLAAGYQLRGEWTKAGHPDFLLAGYAPYDSRTPDVLTRVHAFGDRSIETYSMKVAQAMRSRLDGKAIDDVVMVPVTFHRKSMVFVPAAEESASPQKKAGAP